MARGRLRWMVLGCVLALCLLVGAFVAGAVYQNRVGRGSEPTVTTEQIAREITGISEYATLEYHYTNVGKVEDQLDFYGWSVPFTTKSFIITYSGSMKLGIEGGEITTQISGDTITLYLPEAVVLSHEIDEETLEVMDQTNNIFNPVQIEDYTGFAADQKREMVQKAEESGLFQEARERAGDQLVSFLQNLPGIRDEYTVVVVYSEQ